MADVTVLMTTYNEKEEIFKVAIESIINQTLKDIKILIVVDNPENVEIIQLINMYEKTDNRIAHIVNRKNLGLPLSLNKGIDMINTKYIARMDADDIACNDRIEKQYKYAIENADVDLIGTNITYMDYNSNILYKRSNIPTEHDIIKKTMKYVNIMHHPTFFGKTEIFKKFKYRDLKYSQDYDLTCRLLENGCRVNNLPDYLLNYRIPNKKDEKKLIRQRITYYCIQKDYADGTLSKNDIQAQAEKKIKKINEKRFLKGTNLYDKSVEQLKNGKKISFAISFFKCFIISRYSRRQVINTLKYRILMMRFSTKKKKQD